MAHVLGNPTAPRNGDVRHAAQEFEAVMLRQLVEALRKAAKAGSEEESGGQLTDHLIEDALATHMAKAGGIGLADTLVRAVDEKNSYSVPRTDMHLMLEKTLRFPTSGPTREPELTPPDAPETGFDRLDKPSL
jgi:Rod binding domain-containing protein